MYLDPAQVKDGFTDSAEICIIGSGPAGGVLAKNLAEAGLSVIVLEEGGNYSAKDFNQREADMMPMLYQEGGGRSTRDLSISVLHGKCVGGTAVINNCICFRTPEAVLSTWSEAGGIDSIDARSMEPHFDRVEKEINVGPISPGQINTNNQTLQRGVEKLAWSHGVIHHNRVNCAECGCCMLGCAFGAKRDSMTVYLPRASERGVHIYPQFRVERIHAAGPGQGHITHVTGSMNDHPRWARSMPTGMGPSDAVPRGIPPRRFTIYAKLFIVAGGAVNSPQLLLNSGIANSSGFVGKQLALHPLFACFGLFDEELKSYRGIPQSIYVDQFRKEGFVLEGIFAHPTIVAAAAPSFGLAHRQFMKQYAHFAGAYAQVKDDSNGKVGVDRAGRVVIDYRLSPKDRRAGLTGMAKIAEAFFAAGAKSVMTTHNPPLVLERPDDLRRILEAPSDPNRLTLFSAHPQGSCRMASDPRYGVTDSFNRSFDFQNLFVCDGSSFPTSVGVNPMITIMALADRCAGYIIQNKRSLLV